MLGLGSGFGAARWVGRLAEGAKRLECDMRRPNEPAGGGSEPGPSRLCSGPFLKNLPQLA